MRRIKILSFLIMYLFYTSCIEEYKPHIKEKDAKKYVVYGNITSKEGYQFVNISTTIETQSRIYKPVSGCSVIVSDNRGNHFIYSENLPGEYKAWISQEYLNPGNSYKIDIITPDKTEICSEYELMTEGGSIDSVYFIKENLPTRNPDVYEEGIQFYVDMSGNNNSSKYYKYLVTETWEYHTRFAMEAYFDGELHYISPVDSSKMVCWRTETVKNIFSFSTNSLINNEYKKYPLHYVKNTTEKLVIGYSLLVELMSITEPVYIFHQEISENNYNRDGLYGRQPVLIEGNLTNLTNPENEILGYFFASSVNSKRIFINDIKDLTINYPEFCNPKMIMRTLWSIPRASRPCYLLLYDGSPVSWLNIECVDCTSRGGTTIKPDFWPN